MSDQEETPACGHAVYAPGCVPCQTRHLKKRNPDSSVSVYDGRVHIRILPLDGTDQSEQLLCGLPLFQSGHDRPRLVVGRDKNDRVSCPDCLAALEAGTDRPGELSSYFESQLTETMEATLQRTGMPASAAGVVATQLLTAVRPLLLSADANARGHARQEALRAAEDDSDGLPPGLQPALDAVTHEAAASVPDAPPFDDWPKQQQAKLKQQFLPIVLTACRAQARVIRGETD